jgi:hypothetical protein
MATSLAAAGTAGLRRLRLRVHALVQFFPARDVHRPLGRREIGPDQVLVDFYEQRGVGVEVVADDSEYAVEIKRARRFEAMPACDQPKAAAPSRANHNRLQKAALRPDRFRDLVDLLRPQRPHAVGRNHDVADPHRFGGFRLLGFSFRADPSPKLVFASSLASVTRAGARSFAGRHSRPRPRRLPCAVGADG